MYLLKKPADELDDPDVVYPRSDEMIEKNKINQWMSQKETLDKSIYKA